MQFNSFKLSQFYTEQIKNIFQIGPTIFEF